LRDKFLDAPKKHLTKKKFRVEYFLMKIREAENEKRILIKK